MAAVRVLLRAAGACQRVRVRPVHLASCDQKLVQFNLSDIGEGIREVTVKEWFVKENDVVAQFDEICEVESDKATVNITSRYDGRVTRLYHKPGDIALVGKPLLDIDMEGGDEEDIAGASEACAPKLPESVTTDNSESEVDPDKDWNKSLATPAVRRIAMEHKINIHDVRGSGKKGRVMKEDILAHVATTQDRKQDLPVPSQESSVKPLTTVQKVMTRTMTESLKIPQFVLSDQVDVTKLINIRSDAKELANKKGIKLSYLPFFIKALSKGLSEYPILNSSFDEQREQIVYKSSQNIGIAVDSPVGLLVPNIKDVQRLSVIGIAQELNRLQELASKMKLPPADMTGGTFSVSNIGSIAGTTATPVILPPEVAIVALGRVQRLPRFDAAGVVVPANIMSISWSADHRIIDGATVAGCSQLFKHYVENPSALLLDL